MKNTRTRSFLTLATFGLTAAIPLLSAQDTPPAPPPPAADAPASPDQAPPPPPARGKKGRDPFRYLLSKIDNLTDDQKAKIADISKATMAKGRDIRNDASLSEDEQRQKMMANQKAGFDQVRALLTPDQQKQFDDALASMPRGRRRDGGGGAGGPPPPAPDGSAPPAADGTPPPPPPAPPAN